MILHDEDVYPTANIDDHERRKRQKEENEAEKRMNERIKDAVGQDGSVFTISPSLEEALGINRNASDKPRRVAEALSSVSVDKMPQALQPLIDAVRTLIGAINTR